jgi:hypothetical protein
MSAAAIIALVAIVSSFTLFMVSLAWAERQTRGLSPQPATARASIQASRP